MMVLRLNFAKDGIQMCARNEWDVLLLMLLFDWQIWLSVHIDWAPNEFH